MNPPAQQHSQTSIAAARSIADRVNRLQAEILAFLRERPDGATDDDMQAELGMQGSTQRPRRIELVAKGLVQAAPERRKTKSGRLATVWVAAQ